MRKKTLRKTCRDVQRSNSHDWLSGEGLVEKLSQGSICSPFTRRERTPFSAPHAGSYVLWKTPNILMEIPDKPLVRRGENVFSPFKINTDVLFSVLGTVSGLSSESCLNLSSSSLGRNPGMDGKSTELTSEGGCQ